MKRVVARAMLVVGISASLAGAQTEGTCNIKVSGNIDAGLNHPWQMLTDYEVWDNYQSRDYRYSDMSLYDCVYMGLPMIHKRIFVDEDSMGHKSAPNRQYLLPTSVDISYLGSTEFGLNYSAYANSVQNAINNRLDVPKDKITIQPVYLDDEMKIINVRVNVYWPDLWEKKADEAGLSSTRD